MCILSSEAIIKYCMFMVHVPLPPTLYSLFAVLGRFSESVWMSMHKDYKKILFYIKFLLHVWGLTVLKVKLFFKAGLYNKYIAESFCSEWETESFPTALLKMSLPFNDGSFLVQQSCKISFFCFDKFLLWGLCTLWILWKKCEKKWLGVYAAEFVWM